MTQPVRIALAALLALTACGEDDPAPAPESSPAEPETPPVEPEAPPAEPEAAAEAPAALPEPSEPPPPSRLVTIAGYQADAGRDCDGFPYLALDTPQGICVGIVAHSETPGIAGSRGRFRPRSLLEDPTEDGVMWLIDHGARRANAGRVWRLRARDGAWSAERILHRLNRPHGSRLGPDGWIYVGEVERIIRFDPAADDPASTAQTVIDDLPIEMPGRPLRFHPMTSFVFTPDGDLVVNMGSATDHCAESADEQAPRCHDEADHTAAIWRFARDGERSWSREPTYLAHGLRNSVALVAHGSGTILQAENGTDFREVDRPHEELNVIREGRHYGWPYCYDRDQRDPRWAHASFGCDPAQNPEYEPPHLLLPPHGAPLGMLYYGGERLRGMRGRLLITLHGYRDPGHRVLALPVGDDGIPPRDAEPSELVAGWSASDTSPRGNPVELAEARDGSVWTVEDHNGTVLRIGRDRWWSHRDGAGGDVARALEADAAFERLHAQVLQPRCAPCHEYLGGTPSAALTALTREGWLRDEEGHPALWHRVQPDAPRPMPPDRPLTDAQRELLVGWVDAR